MNKLKRAEKEKVRQLQSFTGASESQAIECLKAARWDVQMAADFLLSTGGGGASSVDSNAINEWFDKYKEPGSDQIEVAGMEKFCADLQVDPSDPIMLVIAWQMKAATMCVFTREEWSRGMVEMGCDSVDALRSSFGDLQAMVKDPDAFREYYQFCFAFAKDPRPGTRTLPIEVGMAMWDLTIGESSASPFKQLPKWKAFIEVKSVKVITKDVWDMLLTFSTDVEEDLSNYDEDGAWPVLIDEFVEWRKESS